jgi:hypothetical protein
VKRHHWLVLIGALLFLGFPFYLHYLGIVLLVWGVVEWASN